MFAASNEVAATEFPLENHKPSFEKNREFIEVNVQSRMEILNHILLYMILCMIRDDDGEKMEGFYMMKKEKANNVQNNL